MVLMSKGWEREQRGRGANGSKGKKRGKTEVYGKGN